MRVDSLTGVIFYISGPLAHGCDRIGEKIGRRVGVQSVLLCKGRSAKLSGRRALMYVQNNTLYSSTLGLTVSIASTKLPRKLGVWCSCDNNTTSPRVVSSKRGWNICPGVSRVYVTGVTQQSTCKESDHVSFL